MPDFIEGYCDPQMPPPYRFWNTRIWSFPLLAGPERVQKVVEKYLPVPGMQAIPGVVYLMVIDYGGMASINPPTSNWGFLTQKELLFGIPVIRTRPGQMPRLGFFCPYIFVDNPWSMVCGNAVLGYPKQLGWFQMPQTPPYPIQVSALAFPHYSPGTPLTWQRLVAVNGSDGVPPLGGPSDRQLWPFGDVEALFGANGRSPLDSDSLDLFRQSRGISYDVIQLKEFRSAQDPSQACYRSVVTATVQLDTFRFGGMLAPAQVSLTAFDSLPIAATLGLGLSTGPLNAPLLSISPYSVVCDYTISGITEELF